MIRCVVYIIIVWSWWYAQETGNDRLLKNSFVLNYSLMCHTDAELCFYEVVALRTNPPTIGLATTLLSLMCNVESCHALHREPELFSLLDKRRNSYYVNFLKGCTQIFVCY